MQTTATGLSFRSRRWKHLICTKLVVLVVLPCFQSQAEEAPISPGHSYHGEAFNEGPRAAAYLMPGMDCVHFPATTSKRLVQQFIDQGVAQLHGFWYYEAERSFRQAAQLDPDCAMAYWGMAMANTENLSRARGFIAEAIQRQKPASRREQMYIEAYSKYCEEPDDSKSSGKRERAKAYTQALEQIVLDFPQDIEAKAFLAGQLWHNSRSDLPLVSHVAVNCLLQEIFEVAPLHPAHHYRIHLWDNHQPQQALASSALCGPSLPAVAHMWHMPGHIYSKLHRYHDACWQQEASARVDHAHMIRDRLLPDQIHNFAHNNEWLIRNLLFVGRLSEAIDLAKNMIELPQHPKFNTLHTKGSAKYGRQRLLQALSTYQLWDELIQLTKTPYLSPFTEDEELHLEWSRHVGTALALSQNSAAADDISEDLMQRLAEVNKALAELPLIPQELPGNDQALEPKSHSKKRKKQNQQKNWERKKHAEVHPQTDSPQTNSNQGDSTQPDSAQPDSIRPASSNQDVSATQVDTPSVDDPSVDAQPEASQQPTQVPVDEMSERKKLEERLKRIEKTLCAVQAAQHAADSQWTEAVKRAEQGEVAPLLKIQWQLQASVSNKPSCVNDGVVEEKSNQSPDNAGENIAGENCESNEDCSAELKAAQELVKSHPGEILPLALLTWILHEQKGAEEARITFEQLRRLACTAELDTPLLRRLASLAMELDLPSDWRRAQEPADDIGLRPDLDTLGPFRWEPFLISDFLITDQDGHRTSANQIINKPTVVIFYLGFGCLHCTQQLQAFSPQVQQFRKAGIDVIAVSTENLEQLHNGLDNYHEPLEIPLHVDPTLSAFKAMRCYDDFENQPLHGTFMVVPASTEAQSQELRVVWQDISHEPFMDVDFVFKEFQRLAKIRLH